LQAGGADGHWPAGLRATIGLIAPAPGSLGLPFLAILLAGTMLAGVLGTLARGTPVPPWPMLVSLTLWQPLVEELLFRGVVQGEFARFHRLRGGWFGFSAANALTAAAFAAAHLVNQPPLWALPTFFPALLFGWIRDRSGSVIPAVVLHAAFNGAFFLAP
jgi:hypothetical protein